MKIEIIKYRKFLISIFICFYVYSSGLLAIPVNNAPKWKQSLLKPVMPILVCLGISRQFVLFPLSSYPSNDHTIFVISFENGTQSIWSFPIHQLYLRSIQDFQFYLYNYLYTTVGRKNKIKLWTSLARYIAKKNDSPGHHPVLIKFIQQSEEIHFPERALGKTEQVHTHEFFVYKVLPRDLT